MREKFVFQRSHGIAMKIPSFLVYGILIPAISSVFILFISCKKDNSQTDFETNKVFTTLDRTIIPANVASWPVMYPYEISKFSTFPGYGIWSYGPGLDYQKRLDLMSTGYTGASVTKSASLLNFFAITDVHITDEESPASAFVLWLQRGFYWRIFTCSVVYYTGIRSGNSYHQCHLRKNILLISGSQWAMPATICSTTNSDGILIFLMARK